MDALIFMLRWHRYKFDKKHARTHYSELGFLHPVGSGGHVVHSGVSRAQNVDALFFVLEQDQYEHDKKCTVHITPNLYFASDGLCVSHIA
jgi:hypothetical protein